MKRKQGYSLLELILVLGIASAVSFMKFQDLKQEQESVQARTAGEQIKQVGEAVNGYINIRYDKLSTLTAATGTGTDPGPRTCSGSVCTITYQTLINEGLLPVSFTGVNVNKSGYTILLKRDGAAPNYVINGVITTNNSWVEGSKIRYDLLGKAMQTAGIDSGMTKTASTVSGYSGSWSADATDYSNVNKTGILGYRVGYDSAMYSVYLRRDGTLPMTGDLNMGGNNINNAKNITASGTTTSGTLKSTGNTDVGANLTVAGTSTMTGALQVNNTIKSSSSITAAGNVTAGNWLIAHNGAGNTMYIGGDSALASDGSVSNDYEIKMDTAKTLTIWNTAINSDKSKTILDVWGTQRVVGNFNVVSGNNANGDISASGNIKGKTVESTGRTTIGEYAQINGIATVGDSCDSNGLQSRTSAGQLLSCVNGVWKSPSSLNRMTFMISGDHENYGDICQTYLNNNGLASAGWVATGSDVCTEDSEYCTIDNVRCYALKSQ